MRSRVYASIGCLSVRLSLPAWATAAKFVAVAWPAGDIDQLLHGTQQHVRQMWVVPCCLHSQLWLNMDFFDIESLPLLHTTTTTITSTLHTLNGPLSGTTPVKPIWILLKQETVSGSGINWTTCKPAPHSRQITMPAPHHSVFLQAGFPSCRPTNSVKAPKAEAYHCYMYMLKFCISSTNDAHLSLVF